MRTHYGYVCFVLVPKLAVIWAEWFFIRLHLQVSVFLAPVFYQPLKSETANKSFFANRQTVRHAIFTFEAHQLAWDPVMAEHWQETSSVKYFASWQREIGEWKSNIWLAGKDISIWLWLISRGGTRALWSGQGGN